MADFMWYNTCMGELKQTIAKNISKFRKASKLTQLDLAEKLNYSDKAVSKWERGECIPDICVLKDMADLFGVTINDFVGETEASVKSTVAEEERGERSKKKKLLITICAGILPWLVACVLYMVLKIAMPTTKLWFIFIYAIPVMFIVLTVFSAMWYGQITTCVMVSALIWTMCLSLYVSISSIKFSWLIFTIGIPLQLLAIFWFALRKIWFKK